MVPYELTKSVENCAKVRYFSFRCGRTGRIGTTGDCRVTNFICKPGEIALVQKIERAVRKLKPMPIINMAMPSVEEGEIDEVDEEYTEKLVEDMDSTENIPY